MHAPGPLSRSKLTIATVSIHSCRRANNSAGSKVVGRSLTLVNVDFLFLCNAPPGRLLGPLLPAMPKPGLLLPLPGEW